MNQTVLVTGGAGYIGSHTVVCLAEAGYRPVILDDFSNAQEDVPFRISQILGLDIPVWRGSVLDRKFLERVFKAEKIEAVIHFAAKKAVGESVSKPLLYFDTNIAGLTTLLSIMEQAGVWRLVFSSSATVYGDPDVVPITEASPRRCTNPYAFTKITSEQILEQIAAAEPRFHFGLLRYFNPGGAHSSGLIGEDPDGIPNNLIPYIQRVAGNQLPHLQVFGDDYPTEDGTGVRDYIHVDDLSYGHVLSLNALFTERRGHCYNLGTGRGQSVLEVLQAYARAVGRELPHKIMPRRPGDVAKLVADPSNAREALGFYTRLGIDEICASSWNFVQQMQKKAG